VNDLPDSRISSSFWTSKSGIALCAFLALAAVILIVEHGAHALQWLPLALLLACPLMHLFHGHGGHGGHGSTQSKNDKESGS
jgi:Protein of unknown function (DUF2933)